MPFSLRSDEELIAEARRALEALGVTVVIDRASRSVQQCVQRDRLWKNNSTVAVITSRAALGTAPGCALSGPILASRNKGPGHFVALPRNQQQLDPAAAARAWWLTICADPAWRWSDIWCRACDERVRVALAAPAPAACQQCFACICEPCVARGRQLFRCPQCSAWYLEATLTTWGVPWDMPRPAPTRRHAAAPSSPALPQRMATAVGPDGWLRPPPQHQRMHPVDALVDGMLAALDGRVVVRTRARGARPPAPGDELAFTQLPLSDRFIEEGPSLDTVRRRLKRAVDKLMREETSEGRPAREVVVQVRLSIAAWQPRGPCRMSQLAPRAAVRPSRCTARWPSSTPRRTSPSSRRRPLSSATASAAPPPAPPAAPAPSLRRTSGSWRRWCRALWS